MVSFQQLLNSIVEFFEGRPLGRFGPPQSRVFDPTDPSSSPIIPLRNDPVFGGLVRAIEEVTGERIEVLDYGEVVETYDDPAVTAELEALSESTLNIVAARDPETGQFVSSDDTPMEANVVNEVHPNLFAFNDIIQQDVNTQIALDLSAGNGSDLPAQGTQLGGAFIAAPPLLSENEPNDVAELVAISRRNATAEVQQRDAQGTTPGSFIGEMEFLMQETRGNEFDLNNSDLTSNYANAGDGTEDDLAQDSTVSYTYIDDPSMLDFVLHTATQGWKDGGAASGGPGSVSTSGPWSFNYRQNFGRGPTFDLVGDPRLVVTYTFRWDEIDNLVLHQGAQWTVWWDMYSYEDRRVQDINRSPRSNP